MGDEELSPWYHYCNYSKIGKLEKQKDLNLNSPCPANSFPCKLHHSQLSPTSPSALNSSSLTPYLESFRPLSISPPFFHGRKNHHANIKQSHKCRNNSIGNLSILRIRSQFQTQATINHRENNYYPTIP